ncbi:MAG: hypothetical protein IJA35_01425 [Clostridia bacterium]|nr:hypothetical protein [Clostridia bacterium]
MRSKRRLISILLALFVCFLMCEASLAANISASVNPPQLSGEGNVTVSIRVANDSEFDMENIRITGHGSSFDVGNKPELSPGESYTYTSVITVAASMIGRTMDFSVTWTEDGVSKSETASILIQLENISHVIVTRTASVTNARPGEVIQLTYLIQNLGTITADNITLTDRLIKSRPLISGLSLSAGESHTIEYEFTMGSETVTSQPVLTYTPADGTSSELEYTGDALILGYINARLDVDVYQSINSVDGTTFTLYLTNDGNQKLRNIMVTDELSNPLNTEGFSLAVGEQKTLTYTIVPESTRYVYFNITAETASGHEYRDKTTTYTVRQYVDPSLINIDFTASIEKSLGADGSMELLFSINNLGNMVFSNAVLTEAQLGELLRFESIASGLTEKLALINITEERMLEFTLSFSDYAGNIYEYTTTLFAAFPEQQIMPSFTPGIQIDNIGEEIGSTISETLRSTFHVLAIITGISLVVMLALTIADRVRKNNLKRKKAEAARKREIKEWMRKRGQQDNEQ